ncbi:MAG: helicase-related protein [Gemmatimonadales bacterium]
MYALGAWHGALLAEPVGSGKTWIALGVAAFAQKPVVAIVPAILQQQWKEASVRAGLRLHLATHERCSRGGVPGANPELVIIDEAHRFRHSNTRRVQTLAPWLVGRHVLLLTATPIVNRLADLLGGLRLALPEDALMLDGILELGELEALNDPPAALARVAIRSRSIASGSAMRTAIQMPPDARENRRGHRAVARVGELALSSSPPIRRLLASVLLDAAASSDAAFYAALRRYRALLLQSRDAGGASRAMLRRFAGERLDQLVLWQLLDPGHDQVGLPLDDIARVEKMLTTTPDDAPWIAALLARCDDERPTICFSGHRATARSLREALGESTAWVTGSEAGIGPHRLERGAILTAFGPERRSWCARRVLPRVLVATDVAAEGLDLHAAGRIVHVDLPWTAMRVEQREGRLLRLGQEHGNVEVIVRIPAVAIESALAPAARVRGKHRLAQRWLTGLAQATDDRIGCPPDPVVAGIEPHGGARAVVAVRLERGTRSGVVVMIASDDGSWHVADDKLDASLEHACHASPAFISPDAVAVTLAAATRAAIAFASSCTPNAPSALVTRIHRLARTAALRRDTPTLSRLDRLLRFAASAPTLGGRMTRTRLAECDDATFLSSDVPDLPTTPTIQASVIAALIPARHAD